MSPFVRRGDIINIKYIYLFKRLQQVGAGDGDDNIYLIDDKERFILSEVREVC